LHAAHSSDVFNPAMRACGDCQQAANGEPFALNRLQHAGRDLNPESDCCGPAGANIPELEAVRRKRPGRDSGRNFKISAASQGRSCGIVEQIGDIPSLDVMLGSTPKADETAVAETQISETHPHPRPPPKRINSANFMSNPTASFDLNFRHPIQAETTVGFLPGMPKNSPLDTLPVAELLRESPALA